MYSVNFTADVLQLSIKKKLRLLATKALLSSNKIR